MHFINELLHGKNKLFDIEYVLNELLGVEFKTNTFRKGSFGCSMMKTMRKLGCNVLPSCNGTLIAKEMW